jgi:hypothetical protein
VTGNRIEPNGCSNPEMDRFFWENWLGERQDEGIPASFA